MELIRINLLPKDYIKKDEPKDVYALVYVAMVVIAIFCVSQYAIKYTLYQNVKKQIKQTETELQKYEVIVKQVEELEKTKAILEKRKNVIETLMRGSLLYSKFMDDLLAVIPYNIAFKNMKTAVEGDSIVAVSLSAESLDNYAIADFVTSLLVNQEFSDVDLGTIVTSQDQDKEILNFNLSFKYKQQQDK